MGSLVLGYDLRVARRLLSLPWNEAERRRRLLRHDVRRVLSVDNTVWEHPLPWICDASCDAELERQAVGDWGIAWKTEQDMKLALREWLVSNGGDCDQIVMLSGSGECGAASAAGWPMSLGVSLGWDVCDHTRRSALLNNAINDIGETAPALKHAVHDLNESHLFRTEASAMVFRNWMEMTYSFERDLPYRVVQLLATGRPEVLAGSQ